MGWSSSPTSLHIRWSAWPRPPRCIHGTLPVRERREGWESPGCRRWPQQWQTLCLAADPVARWRWLAIQCLDLAEASASDREQILQRYSTAKRAELLSELQQRLVVAGASPSEPWRHELLGVIQAQADGMMQSNAPNMLGFARELSASDALSQQLRQLASAALAWGALWENARECRLS